MKRGIELGTIEAAVRIAVGATVGGGLPALGERFRLGTHRILNEWAAVSAFLASLHLADRVQVIPSGVPAAAVGAALVGEHQWQKS